MVRPPGGLPALAGACLQSGNLRSPTLPALAGAPITFPSAREGAISNMLGQTAGSTTGRSVSEDEDLVRVRTCAPTVGRDETTREEAATRLPL